MQHGIPALVVMGVTACGKSTIAEAIAQGAGGIYIEGDLFHSAASIKKMRSGIALDDADRSEWLKQLGELLTSAVAAGQKPVLSCSALKRCYRDRLRAAVPALGFVFLDIDQTEVQRRAALRKGHFMSLELISSQFATLQRPDNEPRVLTVDAALPVAEISRQAVDWWKTG
ncbi:gluconate kinase, SKI family [Halopseudomonas litoralis]|uniref:Gluconokinase n=1 Tax=Halopseudomonas litoralis TaxID=797277 RepID=A0A1H1TMU3_9GAMM|nr:gluconokinase [Halopseudomonas litoralis]SDS61454.1 gluconate kinase, SKI family [Halopseudomonas litoralis]